MSTVPYLYHFYGRECPWCIRMHPLVDRLEHELKTKVIQLEVWHNLENQAKFREMAHLIFPNAEDKPAVPAFYNAKTGKSMCGYVDYETLKKWATASN